MAFREEAEASNGGRVKALGPPTRYGYEKGMFRESSTPASRKIIDNFNNGMAIETTTSSSAWTLLGPKLSGRVCGSFELLQIVLYHKSEESASRMRPVLAWLAVFVQGASALATRLG